jgi:KaiC/GvpD/RAD55 family RecA-like ATPase
MRTALQRSPVRLFEKATGGGLGRGRFGVVLGRPGSGKTAFLIGLALDALLHGRKVLHISTQESVERLNDFYAQIFSALGEHLGLEDRLEKLLEAERHRQILVYNRKFFTVEKLEQSVAFLRQAADFAPSFVILDGTPRFETTERWEIDVILRLAREWDAEVWTTTHTHREGQIGDSRGVPLEVARYDDALALIVMLEARDDHVRVRVLKDHDRTEVPELRLELDPQALLLRWV